MHQQSYNYTEFLEDTASHFDLKGVAGRIKTWKIRSALHQCHVDFLEVERKITFGLERVAGRILQCNNYPPTFYNQLSQKTHKKRSKSPIFWGEILDKEFISMGPEERRE